MKIRDGIKFGFGVTIGCWLAASAIAILTKGSNKLSFKIDKGEN